MSLPQSKVTAQGQISVPAEIRRKLGVGPGSVLEWDEDGEVVVVRKVGQFSSEEIHAAVFGASLKPRNLGQMKESIRLHARGRHARR